MPSGITQMLQRFVLSRVLSILSWQLFHSCNRLLYIGLEIEEADLKFPETSGLLEISRHKIGHQTLDPADKLLGRYLVFIAG